MGKANCSGCLVAMSEFRVDFVRAMEILASAIDRVVTAGHTRPVIVGGAAVEFYTGGAVMSGDIDVVTPADEALEKALLAEGFRKEDRPGWLLRGFYHPDLAIGVEVVGRELFGGRADETKVVMIALPFGKSIAIVPIEDLIADRMGQFSSVPQGVNEMLEQAIMLLQLAQRIDEAYLGRRIREETAGVYDLEFLKAKMKEAKL